jgi:hypothetical protein
MANPMIRIHDISTNEIVDREMTDAEYEAYLNPKVGGLPTDGNLV